MLCCAACIALGFPIGGSPTMPCNPRPAQGDACAVERSSIERRPCHAPGHMHGPAARPAAGRAHARTGGDHHTSPTHPVRTHVHVREPIDAINPAGRRRANQLLAARQLATVYRLAVAWTMGPGRTGDDGGGGRRVHWRPVPRRRPPSLIACRLRAPGSGVCCPPAGPAWGSIIPVASPRRAIQPACPVLLARTAPLSATLAVWRATRQRRGKK